MGAKIPVSLYADTGLDLEEGLGSGLAGLECLPLSQARISSTDELKPWEQGC